MNEYDPSGREEARKQLERETEREKEVAEGEMYAGELGEEERWFIARAGDPIGTLLAQYWKHLPDGRDQNWFRAQAERFLALKHALEEWNISILLLPHIHDDSFVLASRPADRANTAQSTGARREIYVRLSDVTTHYRDIDPDIGGVLERGEIPFGRLKEYLQ